MLMSYFKLISAPCPVPQGSKGHKHCALGAKDIFLEDVCIKRNRTQLHIPEGIGHQQLARETSRHDFLLSKYHDRNESYWLLMSPCEFKTLSLEGYFAF